MARTVPKAVWVLTIMFLIPAGASFISNVGNAMLSSLAWLAEMDSSPELQRKGPVCLCSLVTEPCPLYVLHDAGEPYCPLYTRYCCELEPIAAILLASYPGAEGNRTPAIAQTRSSEAERALESCWCTNYLMPCPVQIYEPTQAPSEWFLCSFFSRFCCSRKVLKDVILPFVANQEQELQGEVTTPAEQEKQDTENYNEPQEEPESLDSQYWWWAPSWIG